MPVRVLAVLCALALPAAALAQQNAPPDPQDFFRQLLLDDPRTSGAVEQLLRTNAGFVTARPLFAELTGDGKTDAVVTVQNGGAAGAIAVYVVSAQVSQRGRLRVVYRNQSLYRVRTRASGATLTLIVPRWSSGDDLCCPATLVERDYAWSASARTFTRRATRELPGPGAPQPANQTPQR